MGGHGGPHLVDDPLQDLSVGIAEVRICQLRLQMVDLPIVPGQEFGALQQPLVIQGKGGADWIGGTGEFGHLAEFIPGSGEVGPGRVP